MSRKLNRKRTLWLIAGLAGGLALALLVLVVSVATYRYVAGHLAVDHLNREAGRYVALLEYRSRAEDLRSPAELARLMRELMDEDAGKIAWIRVIERDGEIVAEAGDAGDAPVDEEALASVLELRRRNVVQHRSTPAGRILVALLPFRFQFQTEAGGPIPAWAGKGGPRFKLAEVALFFSGAADAFRPLKRNLAAGVAASLALVVAMAIFALRFPAYLRGRELEQQLALARRVQRQLLPAESPEQGPLEVTSEFVPFWGVGGDYFDVFTLDQERTFLVLGDVSGKGLPAALIMGLLHGAVRSAAKAWDGSNHDELACDLNMLLYTSTALNRFVTLFWACYEPEQGCLYFVNAGHNPPILVRRRPVGPPEIELLPPGGPVLGLLPETAHEKGDTGLGSGDLLVLFSDGVVEAANSEGVEFGHERLEETLRENAHLDPTELKQEILRRLRTFLGGERLQDDLTLLLVRVTSRREHRVNEVKR